MFMKFRAVKTIICLAFAALSAGAWDLHMLGPAHEAGDSCQVCAVASSPELNADCGSDLLAAPRNFVLAAIVLPGLTAASITTSVFSTRAPPAA